MNHRAIRTVDAPLRILIGCEFSGVVRRAFNRLGHEAWSCDLLPAEDRSNMHLVGDVRDYLTAENWDMVMVFHPPCTRLCNSGVRWLSVPPPGRTLDEMWRGAGRGGRPVQRLLAGACLARDGGEPRHARPCEAAHRGLRQAADRAAPLVRRAGVQGDRPLPAGARAARAHRQAGRAQAGHARAQALVLHPPGQQQRPCGGSCAHGRSRAWPRRWPASGEGWCNERAKRGGQSPRPACTRRLPPP